MSAIIEPSVPTGATGRYLLETSREYALHVCENRAIPHVADGLKHGQRIALWMLRNRADKLKTYALSGLLGYECLYVHGEASSNAAIGLLAAPFKNNLPFIEGLGAFGSRVAPIEGIGAPRYTEVRRSKAAQAILYADLDLVPTRPNYDGSRPEPVHFLPLVPTVLLNGISGVAVGWSTDILPRDLRSLIDATEEALAGRPIRDLPPFFARYNITVTRLGPNQWEFAGKVEMRDGSTIRILELPPGLGLDAFRKRLNALEEGEQIISYVDRSTESIDITVRFRRGAVQGWTEEQAISFFKLRERTTERIVVVNWDGRSIRTYDSPQEVVADFAQWRLGWYSKRYAELHLAASYERGYWRALHALFDSGFARKLGKFTDRAAMEDDIDIVLQKNQLTIDAAQKDRIVNLATHRWTQAFLAETTEQIATLDAALAEYAAVLASPDKLRQVYCSELRVLRTTKLG